MNYIELQRKTGLTYQKLILIAETISKFTAPVPIQVILMSKLKEISYRKDLTFSLIRPVF